MRRADPPDLGSFVPDEAQETLLRAALWEGAHARDAWERWRQRRRIETSDHGSQRLAPLLYFNLQRNGWTGPEMPLLKGTLRKAWAHNARLSQMLAPLCQAWHRAGVRAAMLKGLALAHRYYPHPGARPMDDLDVLVPVGQVNEALAPFRDNSWTTAKGHVVPRRLGAETIRRKRTQRLANRQGLEIELHWHLLDEGRWPGADDALWRRVQPIQLRDTTALIPGPEHLLLHVLVHGAQWNAVPPIRWVADAWMILREAGETFDWDALIEEALARRLVLPIRTCLGYLREAMGAEVPDRVLAALDAAPPSRAEREEFRLLTWPKSRRPFWRSLWFRHLRMRRLTASRSWVARLTGFPGSLRVLWGLDHAWKLPVAAGAFLFGSAAGARCLRLLRRGPRRGQKSTCSCA